MKQIEVSPFYDEEEAEKMREKLGQYPLSQDEREIVVHHLALNYPLEMVAKILGYHGRDTVHRAYTRALSKLRKAGYK